jgi:anti-anti-sigma factor
MSRAAFAADPDAVHAHGDEVTIRLSDDMLADGLADVRWLLHDALMAGARRVIVDLSRVQVLSSTAVASFLSAHRTLRSRGGAVVLRGPNRRTEDLLLRTGLWRVMQMETPPRNGGPTFPISRAPEAM